MNTIYTDSAENLASKNERAKRVRLWFDRARMFWAPALLIGLLCACGPLQDAFDQAIARVDALQSSIDRAISTIGGVSEDMRHESASWREAFNQLQKDFSAANEHLLGETLRNTADAVISHTSTEFKGDIDYLQVKLLDNLKMVAEAVRSARKNLEEARKHKDTSKIQAILDGIASVKVWDDPCIVSFVPNHIDMRWDDWKKSRFRIASDQRIEANGWGFDRPTNQTLHVSICVLSKNGTKRQMTAIKIAHTSNYLVQLTLPNDGSGFIEGDQKVIFQCGDGPNDAREIPIKWGDVPAKPVARTDTARITLCSDPIIPNHRGGDADFATRADRPMDVKVRGEVFIDGNSVKTRIYMWAREGGPDWTRVEGFSPWRECYSAPAGWRIVTIDGFQGSMNNQEDTYKIGHNGELRFSSGGPLISSWIIRGDRDGNEAGTWTQAHAIWKDLVVHLQQIAQ